MASAGARTRALLPRLTEAAETFIHESKDNASTRSASNTSTSSPFRVVHSISSSEPKSESAIGALAASFSRPSLSLSSSSSPVEEAAAALNSVPETLYILDSSFNPPTTAHFALASSTLHAHYLRYRNHPPHNLSKDCSDDTNNSYGSSSSMPVHRSRTKDSARLLLLLSIHNADKKLTPASIPHRLAMMCLLGEELLRNMQDFQRKMHKDEEQVSSEATPEAKVEAEARTNETTTSIDIGLTTEPYFADKSVAIERAMQRGEYIFSRPCNDKNISHNKDMPHDQYSHGKDSHREQPISPKPSTHVHLLGQDTLLRIFQPRYYAPSHDPPLSALAPFFERHRLRVFVRAGTEDTVEVRGSGGCGEGGGNDNDDGSGGGDDSDAVNSNGNITHTNISTTAIKPASNQSLPYSSITLQKLASGQLEKEGGVAAWAERIQLVQVDEDDTATATATASATATNTTTSNGSSSDGGATATNVSMPWVSSTKARRAAGKGNLDNKFCPASIVDWIKEFQLFADEPSV